MGYEPAKSARDTVGSTLGVDSVVGLQSLAKPVLKKLQFGPVVKHSLIRALNKLYKRELPLFGLTVDKAESKDEQVEQQTPSNEVSEQELSQPDTDDSSAQYSYSSYGTNYTA